MPPCNREASKGEINRPSAADTPTPGRDNARRKSTEFAHRSVNERRNSESSRLPALARPSPLLRRITANIQESNVPLPLSLSLSLSLFLFLVRIPGREVRFGRVIQLSVSCFRAQHSALLRASA